MEDVIQNIIHIENQAQHVMEQLEEEVKRREYELEESLKKLKENIREDTEKKVREIREAEVSEVKKIALEKEKECNQKLEKIQKYYEENKEYWANELVNTVLKR